MDLKQKVSEIMMGENIRPEVRERILNAIPAVESQSPVISPAPQNSGKGKRYCPECRSAIMENGKCWNITCDYKET